MFSSTSRRERERAVRFDTRYQRGTGEVGRRRRDRRVRRGGGDGATALDGRLRAELIAQGRDLGRDRCHLMQNEVDVGPRRRETAGPIRLGLNGIAIRPMLRQLSFVFEYHTQ